MTLSPPSTRVQQSSAFIPSSAALQAATRSFSKKAPPFLQQVPSIHHNTDKPSVSSESSIASPPTRGVNASSSGPLLAAQQSSLKEHSHLQSSVITTKSPPRLRSSVVAANLATKRSMSPPKKSGNRGDKREEEEVLPVKGTVDARRKLFQDYDVHQETSPIASLRIKNVLSTHRRPSSLGFQVADATSLEGISSVESSFGKNPNGVRSARSIPAVPTVASSDNASLTAAILATQLYPSSSAHSSRSGSPLSKLASTSGYGSISQKVPQKIFISHDSPKLSLPLPRDAVGASSTGISVSSNTEASNRNDALLAAALASHPKSSSSPQAKPPRPPRPPPPRRAQTSWSVPTAPNNVILDHEYDSDTLSLNSTATGYSRYRAARSLMSSKNNRSSSPTTSISSARSPYLQPTRQLSRQNTGDRSSTDLTAALLPVASLQNSSSTLVHHNHDYQGPLPIPRHHLTGDSVRADPLVPSHVTSTASKKPPAPPAPRRRRRKSLPLPPKTGLRETMRKPPKVLLNEISPLGHKPRLVKHHPHKHSEGERRRWRHFVTEPERKRYEGLWAANKGLFLVDPNNMTTTSPTSRMKLRDPHNLQHVWSSTPNYMELLADCVDSLVVRDIWARSRLPSDYLEDVWNLVDRGEKGHLSRDEFLVGTWLIDQSLKGRKLPSRVQDEVWQSVRRLGVKLQPASINNHRG